MGGVYSEEGDVYIEADVGRITGLQKIVVWMFYKGTVCC
jgi:hypothetical protein